MPPGNKEIQCLQSEQKYNLSLFISSFVGSPANILL